MSKTRQTLGANLSRLMNSSAEFASAPAVERATASKGLKVGRSTVQRVKDAQTTVNLDYIEVFAKVFQKEPWQLLHPQLGESGPHADSSPSPTLAQALEVVATKLNFLTDDQREMVAQRLQTLARAPDSQRAREAVLATLEPSAQESDAQQKATIAPELQEQARKRHKEALLQANNSPDDGKKRHSA